MEVDKAQTEREIATEGIATSKCGRSNRRTACWTDKKKEEENVGAKV